MPAQITVLLALAAGMFDRVPLDQMSAAERALCAIADEIPTQLRECLTTDQRLSDPDCAAIIAIAKRALRNFQPVPEQAVTGPGKP